MENKQMEYIVDSWTNADIAQMRAVWNEVVEEANAFPQEETLDEEQAGEFFASQSHCGVVRNVSGDIQGLYILHPNNVGRCGHICNASYAVARARRGCGIGKLLVRDSLKVARRLGFKIMQFNAVVASNAAAHKLYRRLGFHELGCIKNGFRRKDGEMTDICLYWRETSV